MKSKKDLYILLKKQKIYNMKQKLKDFADAITYKTLLFITMILSGLIIWSHRLLVYLDLTNINKTTFGYFGDFDYLYFVSTHFLSTGKIYDTVYAYPPPSILIILPLSAFSYDTALILKILSDVFCYIITTYYIFEILKGYNIQVLNLQKIAIFTSIILFYPITVSFMSGAINAQILTLTTISYYYLFIQKRITTTSTIIAIASVFKLIPFALILLNKKLRIKTIIIITSSLISSILILGINEHINWINNFIRTQKLYELSFADFLNPIYSNGFNTSISLSIYKIIGFIHQPISNTDISIILSIIKFIIIIHFIWFINKTYKYNISKEQDILYFSLLIILPLLLSNTTWVYYWTFLAMCMILWIYVLNLTKHDKIILFVSVFLISTQGILNVIADMIGGTIKILAYIFPPITIASILMFAFIWNKIKVINTTTTKSD